MVLLTRSHVNSKIITKKNYPFKLENDENGENCMKANHPQSFVNL